MLIYLSLVGATLFYLAAVQATERLRRANRETAGMTMFRQTP